jgi:hypothetical protein
MDLGSVTARAINFNFLTNPIVISSDADLKVNVVRGVLNFSFWLEPTMPCRAMMRGVSKIKTA